MSTESAALWYFAYGSNMARAIFVETRKMQPLAAHGAWVDDLQLCFNIPIGSGERGVANLIAAPGARTHGVIYQLSDADFERLDASEGVPFGLYTRVPVTVRTDERGAVDAWTYQSTVVAEGRKPSHRYLSLLVDGAREHRLPAAYLEVLQAFELAVDERLAGAADADPDATPARTR